MDSFCNEKADHASTAARCGSYCAAVGVAIIVDHIHKGIRRIGRAATARFAGLSSQEKVGAILGALPFSVIDICPTRANTSPLSVTGYRPTYRGR